MYAVKVVDSFWIYFELLIYSSRGKERTYAIAGGVCYEPTKQQVYKTKSIKILRLNLKAWRKHKWKHLVVAAMKINKTIKILVCMIFKILHPCQIDVHSKYNISKSERRH